MERASGEQISGEQATEIQVEARQRYKFLSRSTSEI